MWVRYPMLWAVLWGATGFVVLSALLLGGNSVELPLLNALFVSVRFAFWGAVFGLLFAGVATLARRPLFGGNRLLVCLAVGVGVGIALPLIMQVLNVISGDGPAAWVDVLDDSVWAVPFGALAAGLSLAFAKR